MPTFRQFNKTNMVAGPFYGRDVPSVKGLRLRNTDPTGLGSVHPNQG